MKILSYVLIVSDCQVLDLKSSPRALGLLGKSGRQASSFDVIQEEKETSAAKPLSFEMLPFIHLF